jgi:hypothetical protein
MYCSKKGGSESCMYHLTPRLISISAGQAYDRFITGKSNLPVLMNPCHLLRLRKVADLFSGYIPPSLFDIVLLL